MFRKSFEQVVSAIALVIVFFALLNTEIIITRFQQKKMWIREFAYAVADAAQKEYQNNSADFDNGTVGVYSSVGEYWALAGISSAVQSLKGEYNLQYLNLNINDTQLSNTKSDSNIIFINTYPKKDKMLIKVTVNYVGPLIETTNTKTGFGTKKNMLGIDNIPIHETVEVQVEDPSFYRKNDISE